MIFLALVEVPHVKVVKTRNTLDLSQCSAVFFRYQKTSKNPFCGLFFVRPAVLVHFTHIFKVRYVC